MAALALVLPAGATPSPPPAGTDAEAGGYACRQQALAHNAQRPPDGPPGRGHVAGLVETPAGDLLYSFDAGSRPLARTFTTRLKPGDRAWPLPEQIPYEVDPDATASLHNTVLFNDDHGRIHNFFTTIRQGTSHGNSTLDYRYSDDDGHTWSDPVVLREQWGWMFGNRPFRMSNGEAIVPVYKENVPNGVGFFISDDNFETYEVHPPGELPWPGAVVGGLQAATVELEPGHLLAYLRTQAQLVYETRSFDYGRTWTPAVPTTFPNPWSRVDLLKLDSGNLLLAYNPSSSDRTPLRLALSEDGGRTWPYAVDVDDAPNVSYPFLFQAADGSIHVGYSLRDSGGAMGHVVFDEEFVRSGSDLPGDPTNDLRRVEFRDGEVLEVEECSYAWAQGVPGTGPLAQGPYACRQDVMPADRPGEPGFTHVAGLVEAPSGDLLFWFAGDTFEVNEREDRLLRRTWITRMRAGEGVWQGAPEYPKVIPDDNPDSNTGAVMFDDGQRIHMFFTVRQGTGHAHSTLDHRYSDDDGLSWSDPVVLRQEWGWLFRTRPFRMSNGEVIVPVYRESFPNGVSFLISADDFETFEVHPADEALWPKFVIQAATVELDQPGHLLAFLRGSLGRAYQTRSFDYGRTWTPTVPTTLQHPNSRLDLLRLPSGNLLAAHHPSSSDRTPLRLSLSEDGGRSWPYSVEVDTDPQLDFAYPYLLETSDGALHLGYSNGGATQRHLVFNEAFVRAGVDLASSPNPRDFVTLEYRHGGLAEVEGCTYTKG